MPKFSEFETERLQKINAAKELGYPTRIIRRLILATKPAQLDQAMVDGRNSGEFEAWATVIRTLAAEGIKVPRGRTTVGQNWVD